MKKLMGIFVAFAGVFALTPGVLADEAADIQAADDALNAVFEEATPIINKGNSAGHTSYAALKDLYDEVNRYVAQDVAGTNEMKAKLQAALDAYNEEVNAEDELDAVFEEAGEYLKKADEYPEEAVKALQEVYNEVNKFFSHDVDENKAMTKKLQDAIKALTPQDDEATEDETTDNATKTTAKTTTATVNPSTADGILAFIGLLGYVKKSV